MNTCFLEEVRQITRQELERVCALSAAPERQRQDIPETSAPLPCPKRKSPRILGVSRRTFDYSTLKQISVFCVGRRVLVPINSLEAAELRGSLRPGQHERIPDDKI